MTTAPCRASHEWQVFFFPDGVWQDTCFEGEKSPACGDGSRRGGHPHCQRRKRRRCRYSRCCLRYAHGAAPRGTGDCGRTLPGCLVATATPGEGEPPRREGRRQRGVGPRRQAAARPPRPSARATHAGVSRPLMSSSSLGCADGHATRGAGALFLLFFHL